MRHHPHDQSLSAPLILLVALLLVLPEHQAHGQVIYAAPVWSPTRDEVLYTSNETGNNDIYLIDVETRTITQLTSNPARDNGASWSFDGETILFTSNRDGNDEIYSINRNGQQVRRLTNTPQNEAAPAFTSDGEHIAYCYFRGQSDPVLDTTSHLMTSDGRYVDALGPQTFYNLYPKYSSRSTLILLTAKPRKRRASNGIYLFDPATSIMRPLSRLGRANYNAQWSPQGDRVVFVKQLDRNLTSAMLYISDVTGKNQRELVADGFGSFQPSFSRDGKRIVFRKGWQENHQGLVILDLASGRQETLLHP